MDIRIYHIQSYIGDQKIHRVIGHSHWTYVKILFGPLLIVFLLFICWYFLPASRKLGYVSRSFGIIGLIAYIVSIYKLVDQYLDAIVVTSSGLILYHRNGIRNRKLTNLQRVSIESINEEKVGFWDMLWDEGDISISVEDKIHVFRNVQHSSYVVQELIDRKSQFIHHQHPIAENVLKDNQDTNDRFTILVETLSEVIQDYMKRKPGKSRDWY